jgi:hypothetical protein
MTGWLADDADHADHNPWLERATHRVRRERRRKLNALYKEHGNGPWRPFVPITPGMIALAATHLQTVLYSDERMEGQAHVL